MYPFHEACFALLARVITGSSDTSLLDKDTLFKALSYLVSDVKVRLDYGALEAIHMFWRCHPGEEVSTDVCMLETSSVLTRVALVVCDESTGKRQRCKRLYGFYN